MLVRDWMSKNVVSIGEDESMQRATAIMKEHKVRMLPVIQKGKLVGVVSDTDLKRASASDATTLDVHELLYLLSKIKVRDIMTKKPVTVPVDWTVEETAELLLKHKISGMPVMSPKGEVVGMITRDDIFNVLIALSGLGKKGVQFAFKIEDRPGTIKDLTDIIRSHGGRIASILGSYERMPAGYRMVYIRAYDIDRGTLNQMLKEFQQKATLYYLVDHREDRREIFLDSPA
ncbi:MAG: CBS and ACT domain-containing protein [Syntrophobacteraceae bacterium]|jgi:acetoin utilization protein AcuB|nr:CBS and ACT domain-containing protein [Syntrophobacteraceae bacterium]